MRITKMLRNEEELNTLLEMLIQDAEANQAEAFFDDDDIPDSYPCLIKVEEGQGSSMSFEVEEGELDPEEFQEKIANAVEHDILIYDFMFITQKELKELLEI